MPKHKCSRQQAVEELSSNFTSKSSAPPKAGTRNCLTAGERPATHARSVVNAEVYPYVSGMKNDRRVLVGRPLWPRTPDACASALQTQAVPAGLNAGAVWQAHLLPPRHRRCFDLSAAAGRGIRPCSR